MLNIDKARKKILPNICFVSLIGLSCPVLAAEFENDSIATDFAQYVDSFAGRVKQREAALLKDKESLTSEVNQLKENIEKITHELSTKSSQLSETEHARDSALAENREVRQAVTTTSKLIAGHADAKERAEAEAARFKEENANLGEKTKEYEEERESQSVQRQELTSALEHFRAKASELESQLSDLRPARDQLSETRGRMEQLSIEKNKLAAKLERITNVFFHSEISFGEDGTYNSEHNECVDLKYVIENLNRALKDQEESNPSQASERHYEADGQ